jgi:hypothetical protein
VSTTFTDDPLAPPSGQFALARPGLAPSDDPACPSGRTTRPFGLRFVSTAPSMRIDPYCYSPKLQMSVTSDVPPIPVIDATPTMEWSTITHNDGDEGPSEEFGNDYCPDHMP